MQNLNNKQFYSRFIMQLSKNKKESNLDEEMITQSSDNFPIGSQTNSK